MAFNLGIAVTLSSDKTYITISNEDTIWGDGIDSSADITTLIVKIFGEDKSEIIKTIELTTTEINNFESGINLSFADERFFGDTYAPDNYYVVYLRADDTYDSDWEAFEMHMGLEEQLHINNATVNLRPQDLFQIENNIQAVISADTMTDLSNDKYSPDREYRWRALYYHIVDNIINKY